MNKQKAGLRHILKPRRGGRDGFAGDAEFGVPDPQPGPDRSGVSQAAGRAGAAGATPAPAPQGEAGGRGGAAQGDDVSGGLAAMV